MLKFMCVTSVNFESYYRNALQHALKMCSVYLITDVSLFPVVINFEAYINKAANKKKCGQILSLVLLDTCFRNLKEV
jgi:hypothetical protein